MIESWLCGLAKQVEAHNERRVLVLQIWALSDGPTAFAALWVARAVAVTGGTVEGSLRLFRDRLAAG